MSETIALTQGLPSHVRPGLVIAGKYRLEEQIGRGSMGTVYRAVHVTLGQRVAVKLISAEHSQSVEARRRFSTEAKAVAKLRSRHVVQVYDDGETAEGNPYIVLELLEGETLEQRIERERDISLRDATRVVAHVGRALARAHAEGIVHRDLKPANIFLVETEDDEVGWLAKVLDFGIAKLDGQGQSGTTQAGTVLGTPLFMSPEQVRGASSVDHRADLYSLGMCLYHMLTGEFAFYSDNYSEILVGICTLPLPSLRAKAPWVPPAVELWFQRACAKQPLERFQSADELVEALQAAAGHAALSKHQSVPEGRIAPETLVGYAAPPAIATQDEDASSASLARTQRLPQVVHSSATSPGFSGPSTAVPLAPLATSVSSNERRFLSGDFALPTRRPRPLLIGAALGLLAIVSIAVTLLLLRAPSGSRREVEPSTEMSTRPALPTPPAASTVVQTPVHPEPVVSSVAAERRLPPQEAGIKTPRGSAPQLPATAPHGPKPAPPNAPDADLGF
jgi:eukaryotic-like serine/threonine-protein kinase